LPSQKAGTPIVVDLTKYAPVNYPTPGVIVSGPSVMGDQIAVIKVLYALETEELK
jgi:hypothetical protein